MLSWKRIPNILVAAAMFAACGDDSSSSSPASEKDTPSSSSGLVGDTLVDSRDRQAYKLVTIGSQIWMAKNLNYETEGSYCYKNIDSKCSQYGRLYKWDAAKKACPSGWHLPSKKDFETMLSTLGVLETGSPHPNDAPLKPQSKESGWNYTGTNNSGFTALPAGFRDVEGLYAQEYERAKFWTSTEGDDDLDYEYVYSMYISDYPDVGFGRSLTHAAFSVRCLYDEAGQEHIETTEQQL